VNRKLKPQFDELDGRRSSVADRLPPNRSISSAEGSLCNRLNLEVEETVSPWISPLKTNSESSPGHLMKEMRADHHVFDGVASGKRGRVVMR